MRLPVILLVAGVLLFLVSLTADMTTIGEGSAIGWKQIAGAVVGVVLAAVGMFQLKKTKEG
jgi:steroid 5-alpha reductase family enzyme